MLFNADDLSDAVMGIKLPVDVKNEIQRSIHEKPERGDTQGISTMVDTLNKVSPEMMRQSQEEDLEISKGMCYAMVRRKPSLAQISKLKSKIVHRYL